MHDQPDLTDQQSDPSDDQAPDTAIDDETLPLEHVGEGTTADDPVEDASADSFPASDPPSFTGGSSSS